MSTAQRFLHADSAGGPHPSFLKMPPPIRQNLNRLTALNRTQRAVLIEVAEMAENGKHKAFTTDNNYLVERIGGTIRTITRALSLLKDLGLLDTSGATKLRRITTTPRLSVCYTGSDAEQFAAVEALNVALENAKESNLSIDKSGVSIDNGGSVYRHSGYVSIDNGGSNSRHSVSPYKETNNDQYNEQKEAELRELRSAAAAAEKKIQQLVAENKKLSATNEQLDYDNRQLRASVLAQRPNGANASATHTGGARAMDFSDSEFSTEAGFLTLAAEINCGQACAAYYLPDMRTKAKGMPQRDAAGWRNWVHSWLKRERDGGTGVVTQMPTSKAETKLSAVRSGIDDARALLRQKREGGLSNG